MIDEKKVKPEELSDEQLDQVTGGGFHGVPTVDPAKRSKTCIKCNAVLAPSYPNTLCPKCLQKNKGDNSFTSGPKPIDLP